MQDDYTEICALIDRSGSMQEIKSDTEGGFNAFLEQQKVVPGKCTISLAQFDHEFAWMYSGRPIAEAPDLVLQPRGRTAFLDAMGRCITDFGHRLSEMAEEDRPTTVIFVVCTDGLENDSKEWTVEKVRQLVQQQTEVYSWTFLYLGANMDAVQEAERIGIAANNAMTYLGKNVGVAMAATSRAVSSVRAGAFAGYTQEERERSDSDMELQAMASSTSSTAAPSHQ